MLAHFSSFFRVLGACWTFLGSLGRVLAFCGPSFENLARFRMVLGRSGEGFARVFASIFSILAEHADFVKIAFSHRKINKMNALRPSKITKYRSNID